MRTLMLVAALALAAPAYALTISVPADMPSVQQAIDAQADTVLVGAAYALAEDVTIVVGGGPVYERAIIGDGSHPALGHVSISSPDNPPGGYPGITIAGLALAGVSEASGTNNYGATRITDCSSSATVRLQRGRIEIDGLTVSGAGIDAESPDNGVVLINGAHVSDYTGPGITGRAASTSSVWVTSSTVDRCGQGIVILSCCGNNRARGNTVRDCPGEGISSSGNGWMALNRIERCGSGIFTAHGGVPIDSNVVLNMLGGGIVGANFYRNTVVGCGGNGIGPRPGFSRIGAEANLVAFNAGVGLTGSDAFPGCNLVWQNGVDAKRGAISADPQFCDLAGGDLRVSSSSPAVDGSCGQIGALGVGCPARGHIAAASESSVERFGVQVRGRVALVSLDGPEPGSLDVIDVAGRRLSRTMLASSREVEIDAPAGVVFLRLRQGERSTVMKSVVLD